MNTKKYFGLRIKKAAKLYPAIIAMNLLMIVCITVACALIITTNTSSSEKQKLKVGIVGDLSNGYLDAGITAVQNLDSSRFTIEFIKLENENTAKQDLKNGDITGYLKIPQNFVSAVIHMDNVPIVYVTDNTPTGFGSVLINDVALTISSTVNETQRGIFGLLKLFDDYKKEGLDAHIDNINLEYISSVLSRTKYFETDYVGVSDGLSTGAYFVCGGIMMFLLLWGISCSYLIVKKDRSLEKLLVSKGQSVTSQVVGEYFAYLIVTLVTFLIFAALAGIALQFTQSGIEELDYRLFTDYIKFVFAIIPVILMMTSLQFLFYEFISSTVGVILAQFLFAVGTGYICGCLYPSHYFPVTIQKFAAFLPTGVGLSYMRQTIYSSPSAKSLLGAAIYFIVFFMLTIAIRKHKTEGV